LFYLHQKYNNWHLHLFWEIENEALHSLLYMFLMMFFSLVYRFNNCLMVSMLKHPSSMCLGLGFTCVLWKVVICSSFGTLNRFITHWIDSSKSLTIDESIHNSLNRITYESTLFSLNRLTKLSDLNWIDPFEGWIVSFFILGLLESIHLCTKSFHPSCILGLSFALWIDSLI